VSSTVLLWDFIPISILKRALDVRVHVKLAKILQVLVQVAMLTLYFIIINALPTVQQVTTIIMAYVAVALHNAKPALLLKYASLAH
jgi:hypothetical protein